VLACKEEKKALRHPDGEIIQNENEQIRELWTGTTFSVAALMLADGLKDEGHHTAWGVYHLVYETRGYWFRISRSLRNERKIPGIDVHAARPNLGDGDLGSSTSEAHPHH
jgi:uncharacterized protein (DUF608 family)